MIVVQDTAAVTPYLEKRLGVKFSEPCHAIGFLANDKRPLCAFVFNDFSGANIELTVVAEPGGITRGVLREVARYAFDQLKCRRITARVKKRNKRALKMATRFGFVFENVAKHYFHDDDAVVYRMTRAECRWLRNENTPSP